jgi:pimeloyl-ACP methyl ester carboxylesterase
VSSGRAYAACSFGQVHYRYAGTPGAPVLVLLHQTPSTSEMYVPLMLELEHEFRLLAPDTPGMGQSDSASEPFTIERAAAGIIEFLDEIGVDHCHLFGHHTGASIAVQAAFDKPDLVDSLALCGPTLLDDTLKEKLPLAAAPPELSETGEHVLAMWRRFRDKDSDASPDIALRETMNGLMIGERYLEAYLAVVEQDFESQLAALACPVFVFAGTGDPLYGQLDAAYSLLANGRRATVEDAKSFICETHSPVVAGLLRDFCREEAA